MSFKVLVLDDNENLQEMWRADMALRHVSYTDTISMISASSIEEALEQFRANPDLAVIVLSGCVLGRQSDTLPLAKEFRKTFNGPIIATSAIPWFQDQLVAAGCSHKSSKDYLTRKILEVLGLRKPPS
ncbi:MAG: response regulator [Candidatus Paceibacterota bacterium]|jgi:CheY-like chemotaxis protein